MEKEILYYDDNSYHLLGMDNNGVKYWLEDPKNEFNSWYFGMIVPFTDKGKLAAPGDHFYLMFLDKNETAENLFNKFFKETVFKDEIEKSNFIMNMEVYYKLKSIIDTYTYYYNFKDAENCDEIINKINNEIFPQLFKRINNLIK